MSDKDKVPNVPGGDDRTVFRPNPAPRKTAVAPAVPPAAPPSRDDHTVFRAAPAPRAPAPSPAAPPAPPPPANDKAGPAVHDDRTVFRPNPGGRRPVAPQPATEPAAASPGVAAPRQAVQQSSELGAPNDNPILRAAGPLLLLLGRLRTSLVRAPASSLTPQITEAIQTFEAKRLGFPPNKPMSPNIFSARRPIRSWPICPATTGLPPRATAS